LHDGNEAGFFPGLQQHAQKKPDLACAGRPLQRAHGAQWPLAKRAATHGAEVSARRSDSCQPRQRARHRNAPGRPHRGRRARPGPGERRACWEGPARAALQQILLRPYRGRCRRAD
jgi:hypothetical protein